MLVRILAAVVDTAQLTLYKEDGQTIKIQQGDPRLVIALEACKPLINPEAHALPKTSTGSYYIELDMDMGSEPTKQNNNYGEYEKKSGGLTKFFRVLKTKVAAILSGDPVEHRPILPVAPVAYGSVPVDETEKITSAIDEIMENAISVSDPDYNEDHTTDAHSIVAVIEDTQGNKTVVPDVQKVKSHIAHAVETQNAKGFEAFLARLGAVISQRGHTVQDVLRFMERGDLPLADDGSIIAYKVLTTKGQGGDTFYDCHTKKIPQRVGSYVCQAENLIDKSRATQCSTGLHIARRGYLGSFGGDVIVMVKINPEDVIAVPHNEPDKVRVCGYHILARIPADQHHVLRSNKAMVGTNALKLLNMAIAGEHVPIIEKVKITAAYGGSYEIDKLITDKVVAPRPTKETAVAVPVTTITKPVAPAPVLNAPKVDAKALAKDVHQIKTTGPKTKAEQAQALFAEEKWSELHALKKATKVGWEKLGLDPTLIKPAPVDEPKKEPTKVEAPKAPEPVVEPVKPTFKSVVEKARQYFEQACQDRKQWNALWIHKRTAKKSWEKLGFNKKEIERIMTNKPDGV